MCNFWGHGSTLLQLLHLPKTPIVTSLPVQEPLTRTHKIISLVYQVASKPFHPDPLCTQSVGRVGPKHRHLHLQHLLDAQAVKFLECVTVTSCWLSSFWCYYWSEDHLLPFILGDTCGIVLRTSDCIDYAPLLWVTYNIDMCEWSH